MKNKLKYLKEKWKSFDYLTKIITIEITVILLFIIEIMIILLYDKIIDYITLEETIESVRNFT